MVRSTNWIRAAKAEARMKDLESTKGKAEAKRLAQELRAQGKGATERLKALGRTAGESWEEIRPAIEKAWAELRPALRSAAAKFREAQPQSPRVKSDDSTRGPHQEPPVK